ncbi:protein SNOWY COTYLEDON 3-like [Hibiscus syriacus]|uniref:protein SNOWY COTYLEDON 3-like n=1 Tax=Hibiscus syriacus TaxID=106335 RepID=UPI0019229CAC|nr:protein SNOWY COTYLEDON 3-like [Hibiscus syriacus]
MQMTTPMIASSLSAPMEVYIVLREDDSSTFIYPTSHSSPVTAKASSTSKPAPMIVSLLPKRSRLVYRRRSEGQLSQGNNVNAVELPANKTMITSRRSLSVSFQGEVFSLPISKIKAQEGSSLTRKAIPERRRASPVIDHGENYTSVDPRKARKANSGSNLLSKSVSFVSPCVRRSSLDVGGPTEMFKETNKLKPNVAACDLAASDTDSVSSGSTNSGMQECGGNGLLRGRSVPRNIGVSARIGGSAEFIQSKRLSTDGAMTSLFTIPASPIQLWTSSASSWSRGLSSARGKNGEDQIVDARVLRLLYNIYLQWRFTNAKAYATFMTQKLSVEIAHLEAWTLLERDHSCSLRQASEALKASTLRLLIVGKAIFHSYQ